MENLENENNQAPEMENPEVKEGTDADLLTKERWKQQLEGSKQEAEKYRQYAIDIEYSKASENANSLLELHEKDPKLANEVAKKFGYDSFESVKSELTKSTSNANEFTEEKFEEMYRKRREKEEHEVAIKKAEKVISSLEGEEKDKAQIYFDKISKGKTLDTDTALEFAEMATLYVSKDRLKKDKFNDNIALLGSSSVSNSSKGKSNDGPKYIVVGGKLILDSNK